MCRFALDAAILFEVSGVALGAEGTLHEFDEVEGFLRTGTCLEAAGSDHVELVGRAGQALRTASGRVAVVQDFGYNARLGKSSPPEIVLRDAEVNGKCSKDSSGNTVFGRPMFESQKFVLTGCWGRL